MPSAATKRCAQCGREGVRGFTTTPAGEYQGIAYDAITTCTGKTACRRRWPRRRYLDEYA